MRAAIKAFLASSVVLLEVLSASAAWADTKPVAIVVDYVVASGHEQELLGILRDHARRTVKEEAGCLRFEVLQPVDERGLPIPDHLMVSELYKDESAAESHAKSPRLAKILTKIRPLIAKEQVTRTFVLESPVR